MRSWVQCNLPIILVLHYLAIIGPDQQLLPTFRPFTREIYKYASLKKIVRLYMKYECQILVTGYLYMKYYVHILPPLMHFYIKCITYDYSIDIGKEISSLFYTTSCVLIFLDFFAYIYSVYITGVVVETVLLCHPFKSLNVARKLTLQMGKLKRQVLVVSRIMKDFIQTS